MPRIVPLQLLGCLKVLLDENGGIKSSNDVKRLAGLMTKYSKKLVSKCVYVQILKSTKTELIEEFMSVGGWGLVYTWLNESMRSMNWPLVQELLELLLLCPVDVNRLKINSAPKLVKELCREGGNEHVKILARRLVEQWLKIVTGNSDSTTVKSSSSTATNQTSGTGNSTTTSPQAITATGSSHSQISVKKSPSKLGTSKSIGNSGQNESVGSATKTQTSAKNTVEQDPLADVGDVINSPSNYSLTRAQKKAKEEGLVYKIIVKNGQQVLAKIAKSPQTTTEKTLKATVSNEDVEEDGDFNAVKVYENERQQETDRMDVDKDKKENLADEADSISVIRIKNKNVTALDEDDSMDVTITSSKNKNRKISESSTGSNSADDHTSRTKLCTIKIVEKPGNDKKTFGEDKIDEKREKLVKLEHKSSKDGKERENERKNDKHKEKDRDRKSSSSHKSSSSSHKSASSSTKSSSSSKSKSSSSSSHRSSSDKHRNDKDRSASTSSTSKDKDKERKDAGNISNSSSTSTNKHRSSSSSKSSSRDHHSSNISCKEREKRDKEKSSSSSSSTNMNKKDKDKDKEKEKEKSEKDLQSTIESKSKKSKDECNENSENGSLKSTSITIPSKKSSISIETRRDAEKVAAVKTYKSQFRSHGLTEEAPPPPSRKGLKKPSSSIPSAPGTAIPHSLPAATLKRSSPPPSSGTPVDKKPKIDINNLGAANEKPGAIKLIPAKRIQTLVETNLFSDALSAATGPKKQIKRKRQTSTVSKDGSSPPVSPELHKVAPLKFYQDTLDESKTEEKSEKENIENSASVSSKSNSGTVEEGTPVSVVLTDDDDDTPLKKVKESIQQKVLQEQKAAAETAKNDEAVATVEITSDTEEVKKSTLVDGNETSALAKSEVVQQKKPGPGCGPNGPPGVLMLHRRPGPKKKLTWRPPEHLEEIRFFESDENERVNVTKVAFNDMKNMERFSERDAINIARRGFNMEDNMQPQANWRPLIEVDDVPEHPNGSQSKQRKIQAEREMTTLRALYFSHAMIPDSPTEAELEPHFAHDVPIIPLDDITGNPDAVNDFTSMPWPEPKGSPPRHGDNMMSGSGGLTGLESPHDMFSTSAGPICGSPAPGGFNPFNPFAGSMANMQPQHQQPPPQQMQIPPPAALKAGWPGQINVPPLAAGVPTPLLGNPFNNGPNHMPGGSGMNMNIMGVPGPMIDNTGPPQNFMGGPPHGQFGPGGPPPFMQNGPQFGPQMFNGPNFGGPMGGGGGPRQLMNLDPMMNGPHNNNGVNWRNNGGSNFNGNNGGGDNWRPAGPGAIRGDNGGRGNGGRDNGNNGVCKAFMRGHCRLGRSCKFIHPKSKRL